MTMQRPAEDVVRAPSRGLLVLFLLASTSACDPEFTLRVTVVVPPAALETHGVFPQGVFVSMEDPFGTPSAPRSLLGVICEGQLEAVVVASKETGAGWHGDRGTLWAWVQPLPDSTGQEPCGLRANFVAVDAFPAAEDAWRASAAVFEHEQSSDSVTLVLAPP